LTSTRIELSNYLDNWKEPIRPSALADILGLSIATVRIYKSRMDSDPISYANLLPKALVRTGKKVLYSKSSVLEWWLSKENVKPATGSKKRGRPTKAEQIASAGGVQ
jgi:hypothetical protein